MPIKSIGQVPPDHPMFTQGVSLVFRHELLGDAEDEEHGDDPDRDEVED